MMKRKARIMVVDDEIEIRRALQRSLTGHGYEVLVASSGESALEVIEQHPPDLILLDLGLPGMSGYELALAAKRLRPELRVLYTSGFPGWGHDPEIAPRANTLPKPWRAQQLVSETTPSHDAAPSATANRMSPASARAAAASSTTSADSPTSAPGTSRLSATQAPTALR